MSSYDHDNSPRYIYTRNGLVQPGDHLFSEQSDGYETTGRWVRELDHHGVVASMEAAMRAARAQIRNLNRELDDRNARIYDLEERLRNGGGE